MEIIAGHSDDNKSPDSQHHLPMQSQIALMFMAVMISFAVFASLLNSWITTSSFENKLDEKAEQYIQFIFNEYLEHINNQSNDSLKTNLKGILNDKEIDSIGLYNDERTAMLVTGNGDKLPDMVFESNNKNTSTPLTINNMRYYKYQVPDQYKADYESGSPPDAGTVSGLATIVVGIDDDKVFRTALNAFVWTFLITIIAAICMMFVAVIVIRRFADPFNKLSKAMEDAQRGERGARVVPDGASEIYKMSSAFNGMIAALERREERLLEQKGALERQVHEREAAELALKNITSRLQAIYCNVTDGIVVVDVDHKIVSMNPSAEKIYGYKKGEILGSDLSLIMETSFIKKVFENIHEKNVGGGNISHETLAIRKSGEDIPIEVGVSHMEITGEEHYLVTIRDIAERVKLDNELDSYRSHLEVMVQEQIRDIAHARDAAMAGERAMSTFLANMSHELRTPMHGVLSFAGIALRKIDTVSTDKIKEFLNEIRISGQHLLDIINDLLDLSKMKSGKMDYNYTNTSFINIVENVTREMLVLAEEKNVSISVSTLGDSVCLDIDEKRLMQVVRNLYANAIKFATPATDIKVMVDFRDKNRLLFSIFNFGACVPGDEIESIFESFIQSSATATNAGGTGLGLPICKEIVESGHDGVISVAPDISDGAKFIIDIPLVSRKENITSETFKNIEGSHN